MTISREESAEETCAKQTETEIGVQEEAIEAIDPAESALRQAAEMKDLAQRVQAEFDNYRKRNNEAVKTAKQDGENAVIKELFPLADNFERALSQLDDKAKEGVSLIFRQLTSVLEKFSVSEIAAEGAAFNPNEHNAVMTVDDTENADTVTEVFQKGYKRSNKVLRAAMVKVAK